MQRERIETPSCPACTAPGLALTAKGTLVCDHCGSTYRGKPLICSACGWINSNNAEICPDCGEPISIVAQVIRRQDTRGKPHWLQRVQSQAEQIKNKEERASKDRMQHFEGIDQRRLEGLAKERELRQIRDKKILSSVAVTLIGAFFILLVLLIIRGL